MIWRANIYAGCIFRIVVVGLDPHHLSAELAEHRPLLRLRVYIRPHLFRRAVVDDDLSLVNLIFHVKILNLDVLRALRTACLSVRLEQDGADIVLV